MSDDGLPPVISLVPRLPPSAPEAHKPPPEPTASEELMALLTDLVTQALNGQVTGVLAVLERPDGDRDTCFTRTHNLAERIGYLEMLKSDLIEGDDE